MVFKLKAIYVYLSSCGLRDHHPTKNSQVFRRTILYTKNDFKDIPLNSSHVSFISKHATLNSLYYAVLYIYFLYTCGKRIESIYTF